MLHPSYSDLMEKVNSEVEEGEAPVVNSRYSIVLATAKRARQIIDGAEVFTKSDCPKPLSIAVAELNESRIKILNDEEYEELEKELTERDLREEQKRRETEEAIRKVQEQEADEMGTIQEFGTEDEGSDDDFEEDSEE